jgi:hypothetical protein
MPSVAQPGPLGPLLPAVTYADLPTLKAACIGHARENSYALTIETSSPTRLIYRCSMSGKYNPKGKDKNIDLSKHCHNTGTIKTDCLFRLTCNPTLTYGWKVHVSDSNHNHDAVTSFTALPQYRSQALGSEHIVKIKGWNT